MFPKKNTNSSQSKHHGFVSVSSHYFDYNWMSKNVQGPCGEERVARGRAVNYKTPHLTSRDSENATKYLYMTGLNLIHKQNNYM